jgi:hypothetical protein
MTFNFRKDSERTFKPKSELFKNVEDALDTYVAQSTVENLHKLIEILGAWKRSKKAKGGWAKSLRYKQAADLSDWIIEEGTGVIFPRSRKIWKDNIGGVNCYAYAMKCMHPRGSGNNSHPGKYAGKPSRRPAVPGTTFAQGVVEDGKANGIEVKILRSGRFEPHFPVPRNLPGDRYLVAMVSTPVGYHFMRRNETTQLWTHKNGAWHEVETYYYDPGLEQPRPITNEVVAELLLEPKLMECDMLFDSYLTVAKSGGRFIVEG